MSDTIDTGDVVLHKPSGEEWVVACVTEPYLYWCGWPYGDARLDDCELIRKATPEEKLRILKDCAAMQDDNDYRCRSAKLSLQAIEAAEATQ